MLFGYGWEHLHAAVESIACSEEPLQQRLADAFLNDINFVQERHVSAAVWKRLVVMRTEFGKVRPTGNESAIIATTAKMSDEEAAKWLKEILFLYEEVCRDYARQEYANRFSSGFSRT